MAKQIAVVSGHYIPELNTSLKYEVIGELSKLNHRHYCRKHDIPYLHYEFQQEDSPVCFEKIPVILEALDSYEWVLWLDSDILISNSTLNIETLCNPDFEFISQCSDRFFGSSPIPYKVRKRIMPLNTGAFLIKSSAFSKELLNSAYANRSKLKGELWDGIGEQEVLIDILSKQNILESSVGYYKNLQCHPGYWHKNVFSIHFYGNYAEHKFTNQKCMRVINEWKSAIINGRDLPKNREYFHWCLIQLKKRKTTLNRRNNEFFLYPEHLFQNHL